MLLPHQSQAEKLRLFRDIPQSTVESVGGRDMIVSRTQQLFATVEFGSEPVPGLKSEDIRRQIGDLVAESLTSEGIHGPDAQVFLSFALDLYRYVAEFNWWEDIEGLNERGDAGMDLDKFLKPPLDMLSIVASNNPESGFIFFNFGSAPNDDDSIESAEVLMTEILRGVDLKSDTEQYFPVLVATGEEVFAVSSEKFLIIHEDIYRRFLLLDEEQRQYTVRILQRCFFRTDTDADLSCYPLPSAGHCITEYAGHWGIKMPDKITFSYTGN